MVSYVRKNKLLLFILLIAFAVRVIGIFPGHPPTHPDEPMSFGSAIEMLIHHDLNPRRWDYPAGVPLIHYLFFKLFILPPLYARAFFESPGEIISSLLSNTNLFVANPVLLIGYNGIFLLFASRFLTAFLGALSVFLVYKISEKLFNKQVGIFSIVFLTFNYRHSLSSHLALSDIPNSFFVLLSFYACLLIFEKNTFKRYLFAAICIGVSISIKYQLFALFPFLFVQFYWIIKKHNLKEVFNKNFLIALIIIPLVFSILNPYLFLNFKTALPIIQFVGKRYGVGGVSRINYYSILYLYKWGLGIIPFFFTIIGGIFIIIRNPIKALFLLSYAGVFLFVFLYYIFGGGYVRNFTTVIPLLMIFAGFGFYQLSLGIKLFYKRIPFGMLFIAVLLLNLDYIRGSVIIALDYSKPWSQDVLDAWVEKNIPQGVTVRNDVSAVSSHVTKKLNLVDWAHSKDDSIEEFIQAGDDFAVLNVAWHQAYMFWTDLKPQELLTYMDIPYKKLKDSYYGLSLSEFIDNSVWETYKSWQAPDDSYLVIKIPRFPKNLDKQIKEFHFDSDTQGWKFYDFSGSNTIEKIRLNKDQGSENIGSLEMTGDTPNSEFSRAISPFIKIKPEKTYVVDASVNNTSEINDSARDGFFRIDIFKDDKIESLSKSPIRTAVSGRTYGLPGWKKKRFLVEAPVDSNYLTVSFQRARLGAGIKYFLDDIIVYEVDDLPERYPNIPYRKLTIPDDMLFPIGIY